MVFKRHTYGSLADRLPEESLEARFHQLMSAALDQCVEKGNRKRQGYVMGAFREALSEFNITVERKECPKSV